MTAARVCFVCVLGLWAALGCDSSESDVDDEVPGRIGPAGGILRGPEGTPLADVVLDIPAGALDHDVTFSFEEIMDPTPLKSGDSDFVGAQIAFQPAGTVFAKPVRITVPVERAYVADYQQTTADCKVWVREGEGWSQKPAVANTEETVTAELTTLGTAASGVTIVEGSTSASSAPPCTDPTGYCVEQLAESLLAGGSTQAVSEVVDGKLYYVRVQSGPKYSVVQYDVKTGKNSGESAPLSKVGGAPYEQFIALTPESVQVAIPTLGVVTFPSKIGGTPFASPGTGVVNVIPREDNSQLTLQVSLIARKLSDGTYINDIFANGELAVSGAARVRLARQPSTKVVYSWLGHAALSFGPDSNKGNNMPGGPTETVAAKADDEFAMDATASMFAYSFDDAREYRLMLVPASGAPVVNAKVDVLREMAFGTDGRLYAITGTSAAVTQVSRSGGTLSISLKDPSPTAVSSDRFPKTIRRLPNAEMLVVTGSTALQVLRVRPAWTDFSVSGSVSQGAFRHFQIPIPAGKTIIIKTQAPNDVDLYVQLGASPTLFSYDARGYTSSGNETLSVVAPVTGTLYMSVHGYAASTFTLTATAAQ